MTRLIHLTDLHFGLHHEDLVARLHGAILSNRPDVVVVSGDLTQRALKRQFAEAMRFIRDLGTPFIVIPGNHDLPFFNPFARLLNPFGAFRAGAAPDLTPTLQIGSLRLFGANTADPFKWRGGIARIAEIDRICRSAGNSASDVTNILVCHHPLLEPPSFERGETRGAAAAMTKLADAGVRVVLSGHLHHWTTGLGIGNETSSAIFHMQTSTALSARIGERDHGFAVMDFEGDALSVAPWIINEASLQFEMQPWSRFTFRDAGWHAGL